MADVRRITDAAEIVAMPRELFDGPVRARWAAEFLAGPGHHLLAAYDGERVVGMVTGVETTHPDKGTEMFLYELAVAEAHRRRGIGRLLVEALGALARERGCYGMWVGVDPDNAAALATYASAGGGDQGAFRMIGWEWGRGRS